MEKAHVFVQKNGVNAVEYKGYLSFDRLDDITVDYSERHKLEEDLKERTLKEIQEGVVTYEVLSIIDLAELAFSDNSTVVVINGYERCSAQEVFNLRAIKHFENGCFLNKN